MTVRDRVERKDLEKGNSGCFHSSVFPIDVPVCTTPETILPPWITYGTGLLLPWRHRDAFIHLIFLLARPPTPPPLFYYRCVPLLFSQPEETWIPATPVGLPSLVSGGRRRPFEWNMNRTPAFWLVWWHVCVCVSDTWGKRPPLDVAVVANKSLPVDSMLDIHRVSSLLSIFNKSAQKRPSQRTEVMRGGSGVVGVVVHVWADGARHSADLLDIILCWLHRQHLQLGWKVDFGDDFRNRNRSSVVTENHPEWLSDSRDALSSHGCRFHSLLSEPCQNKVPCFRRIDILNHQQTCVPPLIYLYPIKNY